MSSYVRFDYFVNVYVLGLLSRKIETNFREFWWLTSCWMCIKHDAVYCIRPNCKANHDW